jgi:hypothetical protein
MNKPIGPPNIEVKDPIPPAVLMFICGMCVLFMAGVSTCKISDYEWNTYSSKADCMMKVLTEAENEGVKPDLEYIAKVEGYCKKYDR